ncbi:CLAVATA3/ESR (CLE)-related protein 40-like [Quillaja saponaria]|uniref:CLAVATA3/ESR (CLE)-related protein 40-like n=1 Tax=Quillaja saponaria TaxID=32244 RepID=A0AAD7VLZ6_QUISA|nr:CLAVATA3/ESR (CLE)-related protein 40-like [Quillaja saponaria]
MAFKKALMWVLYIVILAMVVSVSFVQASRSSLTCRTTMAENTATVTATEVERFGDEASSHTIEDSARQVPTGPDPLHHNNHPICP